MSLKRSNSLYKSTLNKQQKCSNKEKETSLDVSVSDFTCPICLEVLVEPVQMPCHHELCLPCFKSMTDLTNLTCPMCRMRISTWSRYATNSNSLVNQDRWKFIQKAFPIEIKNRLEGKTAQLIADSIERHKKGIPEPNDTESKLSSRSIDKICSQPGEIKKEYQEYLKREQERIRIEKENEEKQSLEFIQKLIREEEHLSLNDYLNIMNTNGTPQSVNNNNNRAQPSTSTTTNVLQPSNTSHERVFNNLNNHLTNRIQSVPQPRQEVSTTTASTSSSSVNTPPIVIEINEAQPDLSESRSTITVVDSDVELNPDTNQRKTPALITNTNNYSLRKRDSLRRNAQLNQQDLMSVNPSTSTTTTDNSTPTTTAIEIAAAPKSSNLKRKQSKIKRTNTINTPRTRPNRVYLNESGQTNNSNESLVTVANEDEDPDTETDESSNSSIKRRFLRPRSAKQAKQN